MFGDEPINKPRAHEIGAVLDALSVDELHNRINELHAEIARLQAAIDAKGKTRTQAEAFFKT